MLIIKYDSVRIVNTGINHTCTLIKITKHAHPAIFNLIVSNFKLDSFIIIDLSVYRVFCKYI